MLKGQRAIRSAMIPRPAGKSSPVVALTTLGLAEDSMTGGGPCWRPLLSMQGEVGGLSNTWWAAVIVVRTLWV